MNRSIMISLAVVVSLTATACVPSSQTGSAYSRQEARRVQQIELGTVLDKQLVTIEGTKSGLGGAAGGVIGGIAGSAVGDGKGSDIASAVGAVLGAVVGAQAEEASTRQQAVEYTVRLESGKVLSVVQAETEDNRINVGQTVKLLSQGATYRISPVSAALANQLGE